VDLIEFLPADKPVISESGISDVDTIIALHDIGFKGFLIGENFYERTKTGHCFC
jgi:indole-3-glycerol phosphate synthase